MKMVLAAAVAVGLATAASARQARYGLPHGALIVEERPLSRHAHSDRSLVLWMLRPEKHPREYPSEPYVCPEYTRGYYYSGPTRVSLVDTRRNAVINTLKIAWERSRADTFDVPYRVRADYSPYPVPRPDADGEGTPRIMDLKDYNGDGRPLEFAIFAGDCCMCLETALVGYEPAEDRMVWYPIDLRSTGMLTGTRISRWADHLFAETPRRPGYWQYEIDYRGRGGPLDRFEVRYNRAKRRFEGTVIVEEAKPEETGP